LTIFGAAASSGEKLYHTIDRVSLIDGTVLDDGKPECSIQQGIRLNGASFAYKTRPDNVVLDEISMDVPAKRHTAIVGLSGSGKSTIAALLGRFYDVSSGSITIDGRDIKELNVHSLRQCIGLVEQDSRLLDLSILENVAHGLINGCGPQSHLRPFLFDASLPELVSEVRAGSTFEAALKTRSAEVRQILELVHHATELSDAAKFIARSKHGLATSVGTRGNQLSGGQKQRVALARAIVGDPELLILDEATASLDSASEKKIQRALASVSKGRTVISIAHRLSTIQGADQIIVMRQGKIIERGTHVELLAQEGAYASMVGLQSLTAMQSSSSTTGSLESVSMVTTTPGLTPLAEKDIDASTYVDSKKRQKSLTANADALVDSQETLVEEAKPRTLWLTCRGIGTMLRPFLLIATLGVLASVITGGSYSGEAVIFGNTITALNPCKGADSIQSAGQLFGLLFFVLGIAKLAANVIAGSAFGWIAQKLLFRIRVAALRSLLSKDLQWHEAEGRSPATLLSHLTTDTNALGSLAGTTIGIVFSVIVTLVAGIVLSHIVAWKIAIVLLAAIPVLLGSGFMRLRVLAQFQERHRKAFAQSVGITIEAVGAIKTIATYSLEHASMESYRRSLQGPYRATLKAIAFGNLWLAISFSISILVYALAYWWGTKQIIEGTYTQTQFFIVLPALLISAQSCGQLFSLAPDISKARVAAGNILDLLESGPDHDTRATAAHIKSLERDIRENDPDLEAGEKIRQPTKSIKRGMDVTLRDVRFSYPAQPLVEVLHGVDISVRAGQFCALVGASGSGKSTLIALMERFYFPSTGSIELDGFDILKSDDPSFRNHVALVPQESTLFDGTVAFNVSLGCAPDQKASQADIEEACKMANIHDTIMDMPQGYNTPCGSHGDNFSGGQKQRLSIARALLRKPRLLLLDETTSALDAESEMLLQKALEKLAVSSGMTIIAVAHRLHTIQKADTIFMLEDGLVVDSGRHDELVRRSEAYRENVLHQTLDT
jgi:ATP-binding cassette subfamily B (MDR/TAP) protein 1